MQAIVFDPKTNNFSLQEIPKPKPGKDDVLVKVEACALNPVDFKIAYLKDMIPATANNYVAGLDVSGTIVEVGDAVEDWKTGDRVLYHGDLQRGMGGLAEFAVHKSATLLRHPAVNADDAAATPCAGWTAYRCLVDKLRVNEDDVLVISGASGGVGGFAVQLANILGVKTIVGICSAKNIPYVMSLGATHVIDYKSQDVGKEIMAITDGKGASKVLDAVGGKSCEDLIQVMGFDAELVSIVQPVNISADKNPVFGGHSFHHLGLGAAHGSGPQHEARLAEVGKQVTQYLADGKLRSCLTKVIGLKDVPSALQQMMAQRTVGKVVVSMSQNPSKKHYKK
uniref:Enoyl reductase (ER) domain-containing protein n=1 Tax=Palpitomonas bilix TaxID=652834 RepID=A0A7S3DH82_9EUKA|mmetsp:Transcript_37769/g.97445  ORF Transcript_37769/g.97445 Transcript_37769/m.97445 type:complete len:338 (+) Transcript_37769:517-1530(+)